MDLLSGPSFCVSSVFLISITYEQLIPDMSSRTHQVCFNVLTTNRGMDALSGPSFCVSGPSLISVTYEHLIPDTSSRTHQVCFNVMRLADDKQRGGCAVWSFYLCLQSFSN